MLTALVLGVALSLLGWAIAYSSEEERLDLAFGRVAAVITDSIEHCFYHQIDSVRTVAALYDVLREPIGHAQFRDLVEPLISRCETLIGVYWAPAVREPERAAFEARVARGREGFAIVEYDGAGQLVPAAERELHFPILYAEPSRFGWYPVGFDVVSRPRERETIESIRRTGRLSFVPHDPVQDAQNPALEILLYPIYRGDELPSGKREPAGLVIGIARLSGIVDEAVALAGNPPLGIEVLEELPAGERKTIYARPSGRGRRASWLAALSLPPAIEPRETQLVAADHTLTLRFTPDPAGFGTRPGLLPLGILLSGLFVTGLVAVYLDRSRGHTERIAELARRLSEQDARKNEFLAVLGHELRNPIAPISNAVQILRAHRRPPPDMLEWAEGIIERQVAQLARLVDDLLDVARITRGDIALRDERVDLREVVQRAVETQRPLIEAKRHVLRERLPRDAVLVRGDRARLVQVVGNLLDNAAKYTPENGRIDIEVASDGNEAMVSVRDSGIGIPQDLLPRVFDLFNLTRSRDRDTGRAGLGIGLALARRLVEMQGGRIEVRSAGEGAGSQFTVCLPALPSSAAVAPAPRAAVGGAMARRVLIVEDNVDVATSFGVLLETIGHEVVVARDGPQALEALSSFSPEIAFIDIGLPGMNGYELARRLRRRGGPTPYLVALTGYGQAHDRERAAMAGFDRHLVKPVDAETLDEVFVAAASREAVSAPRL